MNFYAGSFNCDIAHIYGANRRCLSSPLNARGAFKECHTMSSKGSSESIDMCPEDIFRNVVPYTFSEFQTLQSS